MITRWMSCGRSARVAPAVIRPKNGSVKIRLRNEWLSGRSGSLITRATELERRVTRLRAATFGTYLVSAIARCTTSRILESTVGAPLITRETVARETPAASATWSMVGWCPPRGGRELMALFIAPAGSRGRALSRCFRPVSMINFLLVDADVVDEHLGRERRG